MVPPFVMILLTHKCNLDCKYCYLEDKSTIPDKDTFMTADTLRKVITNIAINYVKNGESKKVKIQFTGGEPTLIGAKKFDEYFTIVEDIFKSYDIPYVLCTVTNGTLIDEEFISVLKKHDAGICVSLDGLTNTARYHDNSELDKVINTINLLEKMKYPFNVHTVLTDDIKESYISECESVVNRYDARRSTSIARDYKYRLCPSDEDVLKYYYIVELQRFIDGKVKNLQKFFNVGPGRHFLKYLTDRFTYHTDNCRTTCNARYCGGGINLAAVSPDGYWQMCSDFRGDEDFFNGRSHLATENDFLDIRKIQTNFNFIVKSLPILRKCDKCQHQYYCDFPCLLYIRKRYGSWMVPDSYCEMMNKLYQWYENHLNSILKAIYQYSETHSIEVLEDIIYQKINNDRLDSKYFSVDVNTDKDSDLYNHIIVSKK